jgi:two-component system phosphate regulon sensor histidine kinase PhoR
VFGKRIFWRLFLFVLLTVSASLAAFSWTASQSMRQILAQGIVNDLSTRATLLAAEGKEAFSSPNPESYDDLCKERGALTETRFTLILPSGRVIGDSVRDPAEMGNHADRPEVQQALNGEPGISTRFSSTVERTLTYVAIPVREQGRVIGVVRASMPVDAIEHTLTPFYRRIVGGGLAVVVMAAVVTWWISRRVSRPLEEIYRRSERLAKGDLDLRLPIPDSTEIGGLANAVNRMAIDLEEKFRAMLRQSREQEAILSSMAEGVLMVDVDGRLVRANRAASTILGDDAASGASVENPSLKRLIARTLARGEMQEESMVIGDERHVEAQVTPLRDSFDRTTGALVVLNDRTRLRKLENLRRDFAAHASHELKTPLTAIQGFADTLLAGALGQREDAERFVRVIAEQAGRLQGVVEGLMELANLEQAVGAGEIRRSWHDLADLLDTAVGSLEDEARARGMEIVIESPKGLACQVNATLLEQALINLVDNALRYSGGAGRVRVVARQEGRDLVLEVEDEGEGIAEEDRRRIFERFYRAPSARLRHPEGSGLGLAIVNYIVLAHGGTIEVDSEPGVGSTFRIRIPRY